MSKLKVGQKAWLRPSGNQARKSKEIKEAIISKVGRKYFELEGFKNDRFFIETLWHDGRGNISDWQVYLSSDELIKEQLANRLYAKLQVGFSGFKNPYDLETLKKVAEIMGVETGTVEL